MRIWVGGNNKEARREVEGIVAGMSRPPFGPLDAAIITPETNEEAAYFAAKHSERLVSDACLWIVTPRVITTDTDTEPAPLEELLTHISGVGFSLATEVALPNAFRAHGFLACTPS